ncbi:GNAT family N-acetyltransferase [Streptomyces chiangmaiensis]|uniref:N-acetyltransferase n=1 Tax=Streptomyces chiangmaiensis TaxID=766497 RepID=A0ABU7FVK1_9ACTN|nr:N-acetyltransferase [Streptomyces chiangmaiensis]MED7828141.1 N-acetyltransferase [Streptomyces chiangmaiensis]
MAGVLLDDRAQDVRVVDEAEGPRYALYVDAEQAGVMVYRIVGRRRVLGHTEIDEGYCGLGLSRVLIRAVLNDLQQRKEKVTIYCPAIDRFIKQSRQVRRGHRHGSPGNLERAHSGWSRDLTLA